MAKVFRIEKDTLENASYLFSGCTDLEVFSSLDNYGGWGENGHYYPALENATAMFNDAYNLKVAYCSMPNLITATEMFGAAGHLREYDLNDMEKCFIALELGGRLTDAENMFDGAENFKHIDVRNIGHKISSKSANYKRMFQSVKEVGGIFLYITSESLENLDMTYAFNGSYIRAMKLPLSEEFGRISVSNCQKIKNCSGMFNNCFAEGGIFLNYSSQRVANNQCNLSSMFYQTRTPKISINGSLQEVYKQGEGLIGGLCYVMNTASNVNIGGMFDGCTFPESVDWVEEPKSWESGGVYFTDATGLFGYNTSLRSFTAKNTLNGIDGSWSIAYMAFGYSYIEELSLTNSFNNCTTDQMFLGCSKLKNVYIENSLNSPMESCDEIFSSGRLTATSYGREGKLESITLYNAFANCASLTNLCYNNYGAGWDGKTSYSSNPGTLTVSGTGCGAEGVNLRQAFGVDCVVNDTTGALNFPKLVFVGNAYSNGGWRNIGNVEHMFRYRQIADESTINWVSTCATYSTVSSTTSIADFIQTPYNMINTWKNYGWTFGTASNSTSYSGYKEVTITHSTSSGKSITAKLVYKPS